MNPIENKHILLGVTGSIAAYKAADLASKLTQNGAKVDAILTKSALNFINPITYQSVTGRQAYTESDLWGNQAHVLHIGLARKADLFVISPVSANTLGKLANGLADNLLTVTALAFHSDASPAPLLLAPAMDAGMFAHPATQHNLDTLQKRGSIIIGPEQGHLASGLVATGRMSEPATILGQIRYQLSRGGPLDGKHIVVTAGGTQEMIDPVRFITNRSSGKQGFALAQAVLNAGAKTTLISAPTNLTPPIGVKFIPVRSAHEMESAVLSVCTEAYALLMVAAVADFRPAKISDQKIKKDSGAPSLVLEPTTDILKAVKSHRQQTGSPKIVVGFAAETQNLLLNAQNKLQEKGLDLIVANDVSVSDSGFGVDTNRVTLLWADGKQEALPLMEKQAVADKLVEKLVDI